MERLFTVGVLTRFTAERFGAGARHFSTQAELIDALAKVVSDPALRPATLLVKGSRRMQMERVVESLLVAVGDKAESTARDVQT